MYSLGVRFTS